MTYYPRLRQGRPPQPWRDIWHADTAWFFMETGRLDLAASRIKLIEDPALRAELEQLLPRQLPLIEDVA